jgi:hypothetical protein
VQVLALDGFDIVEDFEYNCTPRLRREVRQIVFEHFAFRLRHPLAVD